MKERERTAEKRVLFLVFAGEDGVVPSAARNLRGKVRKVYVEHMVVEELAPVLKRVEDFFSSDDSEVWVVADFDHDDQWPEPQVVVELCRRFSFLGFATQLPEYSSNGEGSQTVSPEEYEEWFRARQKGDERTKPFQSVRKSLMEICR